MFQLQTEIKREEPMKMQLVKTFTSNAKDVKLKDKGTIITYQFLKSQ